jgi:hypothetical protein
MTKKTKQGLQIVKGLELAYERMIAFKRMKKTPLVMGGNLLSSNTRLNNAGHSLAGFYPVD